MIWYSEWINHKSPILQLDESITDAPLIHNIRSSLKPKFHYADFHRNFRAGKAVDWNHESCRHKWWQIMKSRTFGESRRHKSQKWWTQTISSFSTCWDVCDKVCNKSTTNLALMEFSPLQCTRKVGDKVRRLCRGHKSQKLATWFVLRTSMICVRDKSRGLCRKVSVMEFRFNWASSQRRPNSWYPLLIWWQLVFL